MESKPFENKKDLEEIPNEVRDDITYIPVKHYKEVYAHLFEVKEVVRLK